jgi:hypothetical protein
MRHESVPRYEIDRVGVLRELLANPQELFASRARILYRLGHRRTVAGGEPLPTLSMLWLADRLPAVDEVVK